MLLLRLLVLCLTLLVPGTVCVAQEVAMTAGNAQRSRVLPTEGPRHVPQELLWASKKLFNYRPAFPIIFTIQTLPRLSDIPMPQDFTFPIVAKGIVYLTYNAENGYFFALDAVTGAQLVTLKFNHDHVSQPAALDGTVYFGTVQGIHAYDARKGRQLWIFEQKRHSFSHSALTIHEGVLYVAGEDLFALDALTGAVNWSFQNKNWIYEPAVGGGSVVFETREGHLIALDIRNGTKQWEVKTGNAFPPAILDDQIFLHLRNGEVRAYRLRDGSLIWKVRKKGGAGTALVLSEGNVIYGGRDHSVYALDHKTGEDRWQFKTKRPCYAPIAARTTLYIGCEDRKLYAIDARSGQEEWRYDNKKADPPPPTFAGGVMYMLGSDGILAAVR